MTTYDAVMVIVVVLGMVRGAWRGFTWQMASITSLVLGYTAAHTMSARIAFYLPGEPEVQRMLAMSVVYIAVSGGIFGIAWMIRGTLRKLKFEAFDRHLGMLLGGLEGVSVGMLATMFVVSLAPATRQPIFSSTTGRVVGTVMNNLGPVLPVEVRKVLAPHWDGSFSEAVAAHDANEDAIGTDDPAGTSGGIAASSKLPALHEVEADGGPSASAVLPALPALVSPAGEDQALERASGSPRSDAPAPLLLTVRRARPGWMAFSRRDVKRSSKRSPTRSTSNCNGLEVPSPPRRKAKNERRPGREPQSRRPSDQFDPGSQTVGQRPERR